MPNNKNNEMANRISQMPNDKLIEMVTTGAKDYTAEAVEIAKLEITKRGGMEEINKNIGSNNIKSQSTIEQVADNVPKKSYKLNILHLFLWWKIDNKEIDAQIEGYDVLKLLSARGISFLLIIFSTLATIILTVFFNNDNSNHIDILVLLLLILGYFVYKGHQWSMIFAMILWSIDKFYLTFAGLQDVLHTNIPGGPFVHLIWWSIYMHFFYLSLKVEQQRQKRKNDKIIDTNNH